MAVTVKCEQADEARAEINRHALHRPWGNLSIPQQTTHAQGYQSLSVARRQSTVW